MITKFVEAFDKNRDVLRKKFMSKHPDSYHDIVRSVMEVITNPEDYITPDPTRIEVIDHGEYQGTLLFVIGSVGYQPDDYWFVKVNYGSCSGCDTLESIKDLSYDDVPTDEQVQDYMTLALHIVQGLKSMQDE